LLILSFQRGEEGEREREKWRVIQSATDSGGKMRGKNSGTEGTTLSNIQSEKGPREKSSK